MLRMFDSLKENMQLDFTQTGFPRQGSSCLVYSLMNGTPLSPYALQGDRLCSHFGRGAAMPSYSQDLDPCPLAQHFPGC